MIHLDGSRGEGGGQILRTALSLSLCTGTPFRIRNIRANRPRPGLRRQHLAAVQAAAAVGNARTEGAAPESRTLVFHPQGVHPGHRHIDIGSAGSTTLVLQTLLPPLMTAPAPSDLRLVGGTHNPLAPPFEFLERAFVPVLHRLGAGVSLRLDRHGFFPGGGGRMEARIEPATALRRLDLPERGAVLGVAAEVLLAHLPEHIFERERDTLAVGLDLDPQAIGYRRIRDSAGPGNAILVTITCDHAVEVVAAFGRRGVRAENVAAEAIAAARRYLEAEVPVGEHLADQLLLPAALAGGGSFVTLEPSAHFRTNAEVVEAFLPVTVHTARSGPGRWRVDVEPGPVTGA